MAMALLSLRTGQEAIKMDSENHCK